MYYFQYMSSAYGGFTQPPPPRGSATEPWWVTSIPRPFNLPTAGKKILRAPTPPVDTQTRKSTLFSSLKKNSGPLTFRGPYTIDIYGCRQGRFREGAEGHAAPNRRLSGFFYEKIRLCWDCSLHQKCSVDIKYAKNALAAGAPPLTPLRELTTHPRPPSRLGRGTASPILTPLGAFGASILAPSTLSFGAPQYKILATPLVVVVSSSLFLMTISTSRRGEIVWKIWRRGAHRQVDRY